MIKKVNKKENYIDKLITNISADFKAEVGYFRNDILKTFEAHFNKLSRTIDGQKNIIDEHGKELKKHSKILENHCVSITGITKDLNEIKKNTPKNLLSKPLKVGLIIYVIIHSGLFIAGISLMLKILSKVN